MLAILAWLGIAYGCYCIAKSKGLNTTFWSIMGVIFGIFTLIVLLFIPSNN